MIVRIAERYNYKVFSRRVGRHVAQDVENIRLDKPDVIFNLVEAVWNKGELNYVVPALLGALQIPYTGTPADALFLTTNKVLAKRWMNFHGLPTPEYLPLSDYARADIKKTWIVKPVREEASVDIIPASVCAGKDLPKLVESLTKPLSYYFLEEYIDGREMNVSMLFQPEGPIVLPPAEMVFSSWFDTRPKILDYQAKWEPESEAYRESSRSFETLKSDHGLLAKLRELSLKAWAVFGLKGYARVDFRMDTAGNLFILEINGNPCISPDSGFIAAVRESGLSLEQMLEGILADLN